MDRIRMELMTRGWSTAPVAVSADELECFYSAWRAFFASSSKVRYRAKPGALAGYFPLASETAGASRESDRKEFFHFFDSRPCPSGCLYPTKRVFETLRTVAISTLEALRVRSARSIGQSGQLVLRIAHYPTGSGYFSAAAHSDLNMITLLPSATCDGLQVWSPSGAWEDIPNPAQHELVILAGDMLAATTRAAFSPTVHRVQAKGISRMSASFFVNPELNYRFPSGATAAQLFQKRSGSIRGFDMGPVAPRHKV